MAPCSFLHAQLSIIKKWMWMEHLFFCIPLWCVFFFSKCAKIQREGSAAGVRIVVCVIRFIHSALLRFTWCPHTTIGRHHGHICSTLSCAYNTRRALLSNRKMIHRRTCWLVLMICCFLRVFFSFLYGIRNSTRGWHILSLFFFKFSLTIWLVVFRFTIVGVCIENNVFINRFYVFFVKKNGSWLLYGYR